MGKCLNDRRGIQYLTTVPLFAQFSREASLRTQFPLPGFFLAMFLARSGVPFSGGIRTWQLRSGHGSGETIGGVATGNLRSLLYSARFPAPPRFGKEILLAIFGQCRANVVEVSCGSVPQKDGSLAQFNNVGRRVRYHYEVRGTEPLIDKFIRQFSKRSVTAGADFVKEVIIEI